MQEPIYEHTITTETHTITTNLNGTMVCVLSVISADNNQLTAKLEFNPETFTGERKEKHAQIITCLTSLAGFLQKNSSYNNENPLLNSQNQTSILIDVNSFFPILYPNANPTTLLSTKIAVLNLTIKPKIIETLKPFTIYQDIDVVFTDGDKPAILEEVVVANDADNKLSTISSFKTALKLGAVFAVVFLVLLAILLPTLILISPVQLITLGTFLLAFAGVTLAPATTALAATIATAVVASLIGAVLSSVVFSILCEVNEKFEIIDRIEAKFAPATEPEANSDHNDASQKEEEVVAAPTDGASQQPTVEKLSASHSS